MKWERIETGCCKLTDTESDDGCACTYPCQVCWTLSESKLFSLCTTQLDPLCQCEDCQLVAKLLKQVEFLVNDLLNVWFTAKCWRGIWAPPQEVPSKGFEYLR